jgi:hypothetical protein
MLEVIIHHSSFCIPCVSPFFSLKPSRQCWEHLAAMALAGKSASQHRTPGRARVVFANKKRRPCILPGLRDRKLAGGYLGKVLEFSPKPTVIASAYGKTLHEMRRRKHVIYDALKSAWRIGQKRRDKAGVWACFGATQGHVLLRKGSAVRRLTEKEWDAMKGR